MIKIRAYKAGRGLFTPARSFSTAPNAAHTTKLSNGLEIPYLGFGTWKAAPSVVGESVQHALNDGYRHLDCAAVYSNEQEVGAAITNSKVPRNELWITSKLWNTEHRPSRVRSACEKTLMELKVEYLDLYLIHWPVAFIPGEDGNVKTENVPLLDTWHAMEDLVKSGLVRSIGVSNFGEKSLSSLKSASIQPSVNQIEVHAYLSQQPLVKYCQDNNIAVTGYSPLANNTQPGAPNLLTDTVVKDIANKLKRTPAQVLLRWLIQRNIVVIPKSVTPSRIQENAQIFDFELSSQEMQQIDKLNRNHRVVSPPWASFV